MRNPALWFREGFAGPRIASRSSSRPRSSTRARRDAATSSSPASKKPKKRRLSSWVLLWLSSSMAATRPTTSPLRSARYRFIRACSKKGFFAGSNCSRSEISSGGTQWESPRYFVKGYLMKRFRSARDPTGLTLVVPTPRELADHAETLADGGEGLEEAFDLLGGVVGVDAGADDALPGGDAGGQRGGREDPRLPQPLPEDHRQLVGADQDRHDLGLRTQSVEA